MGAKNCARARRHLIQPLDKTGSFCLETFDDIAVVNDLVANINGRPVFFERAFNDVNRADDSSTKSARLSQYDFHDIYLAEVEAT